jgi:hypothetical protein
MQCTVREAEQWTIMRQNLTKIRNLNFSIHVWYCSVININIRFIVISRCLDWRASLCRSKTSRILVFSLSLLGGECNVLCGVRSAFTLIMCHMSDDILELLSSEYCTLCNCQVFTSVHEYHYKSVINTKIYNC